MAFLRPRGKETPRVAAAAAAVGGSTSKAKNKKKGKKDFFCFKSLPGFFYIFVLELREMIGAAAVAVVAAASLI